MIHILFVCHGNICRSPMAEFILKAMAKAHHVSDRLLIASAATSPEELGNDMSYRAKSMLTLNHIPFKRHTATKLTRADYDRYDYIIGMDSFNMRNMLRLFGDDPQNKLRLLLSFAGRAADIDDPWYSDNYEIAYSDIYEGCEALMTHLMEAGL